MAKDSDKCQVLARRKQELGHALTHGFSPEAIELLADKLKAAAVAMLKKYAGTFAHVGGAPGHSEWKSLQARWEGLTVDEVIELSARWGSKPTLRDVRFVGVG